jgi:hypothetical protein
MELAREYRVAVGGAAADALELGETVHLLTGAPVDEAEQLTRLSLPAR